jgi:hypothetical protein
MRSLRNSFLAACLGILVVAPGVVAQDTNLAFAYRVRVNVGQERAFEAAMREHVAFRQEQGEPFSWEVYQVAFGDDAGQYLIRTANHSWADLDTYNGMGDFQRAVGDQFNSTILPFIAESSSWVTALDTAMSVMPPNMDDMNVFMVNRVWVDSEGAMEMEQAMRTIRETAMANDMHYVVLRTLVGAQGSDLALVVPSQDFAGLEEPSPGMDELLMQALGEDGMMELFGSWLSGIEETSTSIIVLRRDLSVAGSG